MHGYFIFFHIFSNADTFLSTWVLSYSSQKSVIASVMKACQRNAHLNVREWKGMRDVECVCRAVGFEASVWRYMLRFSRALLKAAVESPSISMGNFMTNSLRNMKMCPLTRLLFWSSIEWAEHSFWLRFCHQDLVAAVLFTSASRFVIFPFCPAGPAISKLSFP